MLFMVYEFVIWSFPYELIIILIPVDQTGNNYIRCPIAYASPGIMGARSEASLAMSQLTTCTPPPPGRNEFLIQKVAQSFKTNEKSIFRFLVIKIWSILCSKFSESSNYFHQNKWPKMSNLILFQKIGNVLKRTQNQFLDFWNC